MRYSKLDMTRYPDCHGLYFDQVRGFMQQHYGIKTSDWPKPTIVCDGSICADMHEWFDECWNCGTPASEYAVDGKLEAHHLIGGARRSDEYCNISMLCHACHEKVKTDELPMSRLCFQKWYRDQQHCDWVRLFWLANRFLEIAE